MEVFEIGQPLMKRHLDAHYPSYLHLSAEHETIQIVQGDTAYGYVQEGKLHVASEGFDDLVLQGGMFFSIPGPAQLQPFVGFVSVRCDYHGVTLFGGPLERLGRLKYIDGCSDSVLIAPALKGDPCLNYLYVPPYVNQTAHTHPSVRLGIVVEGAGYCLTQQKTFVLSAGNVFLLPADEIHSFHTSDAPLRIVVYHPDSDFGPTHEEHPMVNRSLLDGVPLSGVNPYRTQTISEYVQPAPPHVS